MGESNTTSSRRILLIDDERLVTRVMKRALRGHEIETADSVPSALALIEQDPDFGLVLCDLHLGHDSGIDLYKDVAQRWPALASRFVFVHGGITHNQDEIFLRKLGNEQMIKPVAIPALREAPQQLCEC